MSTTEKYGKALSRNDLSQWLVHLCKKTVISNQVFSPFEALENILKTNKVFASKIESITRYDPIGASCFYDIPPSNYSQVIDTNPNNRRGYGIIVSKTSFWHIGGRPVIYNDKISPSYWPENERYRLVYTDLNRNPPADWTHEREWRKRGDFELVTLNITGSWWWPCVEKIKDAQNIFRSFSGVCEIFILELGKVVNRDEIFI